MNAAVIQCAFIGLSWLTGLPWKVVCLTCTVLYILPVVKRHLSDPYFVDFHTELNSQGDANERRTRTEWINMGYWRDTNDFPKACEALALKLIDAARCKPGGVVLEVGHGCGDSLLLHLEHPSVPRPQRLVGITSQYQHYSRSLTRTAQHNHSSVEVTLFNGDAVCRGSRAAASTPGTALRHPLDSQQFGGFYTSILALDCAYHFDTRRTFLEQSFKCLAPGGRIALGDLCFKAGSLSLDTRLMIAVMGSMPRENITTNDQYVAALRDIGFVDVVMEDITEDVFPGFVTFLQWHGFVFRFLASHFERLVSRGMRFVVISASRPVET